MLANHGPALRLFAATWSDNPDDCVQQALIKLAAADPIPDNPVAWMYTVTRNEAINCRRRQSRMKTRERIAAKHRPQFEYTPESEFDSERLEWAMSQLEQETRAMIVAKVWGGLTFEQIAVQASCSPSSAHRRFTIGLKKLRDLISENVLSEKHNKPSQGSQ